MVSAQIALVIGALGLALAVWGIQSAWLDNYPWRKNVVIIVGLAIALCSIAWL